MQKLFIVDFRNPLGYGNYDKEVLRITELNEINELLIEGWSIIETKNLGQSEKGLKGTILITLSKDEKKKSRVTINN